MAEAEEKKLRLVFMGTPDFAATVLERVLAYSRGEVVAVYTQPDRPCGRGRACKPSPVKKLALERDIEVRQPLNFKDPAAVEELAALEPDALLVAAYGLILPQAVLDVAPLGAINVHASLLPKYRGAAPIQRAIQAGERATGISIMQMEAGLDTGPVLSQRALGIAYADSAQTIHDQLAEMGGELLVETLEQLCRGPVRAVPQDDERACYAPKLSKDEGRIAWNRPVKEIHDHIRAMHPWPGAFFDIERPGQQSLRVTAHPGEIALGPDGQAAPAEAEPGAVLGLRDCKLAVAGIDGVYLLSTIHPKGKKAMDAAAFACGYLNQCDGTVTCREPSEDTAGGASGESTG